MKLVPGQLNFLALPPGQTAPFDYGALQRAGLPAAPYIEHGSWETGQPDLMMYGRDPYRGMMGIPMRTRQPRLDRNQGNYVFEGHRYASQPLLGVGTIQEYVCSDTQAAVECAVRRDTTMRTSMFVAAGASIVAGLIGSLVQRPALGALAGGLAGGLLHMTWATAYRD